MESIILLVLWAVSVPISVICAKKIGANQTVAFFAAIVAPFLAPIVYGYLASNHKANAETQQNKSDS